MNVNEAILARKSVRAFLNKPVDINIINQALDVAKRAPSSTNTQPWEVAVVSGKLQAEIKQACTDAYNNGVGKSADYSSYPKEWVEPFKSRRKRLGEMLYGALAIEYGDREGQKQQWISNYGSFGAPVVLFVFIDKVLDGGGFSDSGMFLQSLMLSLQSQGLATCAQASFIDYADIIKTKLGGKYLNKTLLYGLAIGYEDVDNPVNQFRSEREPLENFVEYFLD